jgi:adenosylcobinamide-GDP ribazoletransferase
VVRRGQLAGIRLALTTFTVLPIHATGGSESAGASAPVASAASAGAATAGAASAGAATASAAGPDRATAGVAMSVAPAVGAVLGTVLAGLVLGVSGLGAAPPVAAVLAVAASALLTRGLHLDGLADTVDGLGSYRDASGALAIMRRPDVGPFGVVALVLVLVSQIAAVAEIVSRAAPGGGWPDREWVSVLAAVAAATAAGRLAITAGCRRGVPSARPDGLGATVAGTVGPWALIIGAIGVAALAVAAVPWRPWQGPVAVATGLIAAGLLRRHAVRRLGGVSGDVLGALCETAVTVAYLVMSM